MNIQLSGYLYYLHLVMHHLQQDDLNIKASLSNIVQAIETAKPGLLLTKMQELRRYDYETLMFPVESNASAKVAMIYYSILQLFNHRHHQQARLYTQELMHQLWSSTSSKDTFLNIPRQLINNLKKFYVQAHQETRSDLMFFLKDMKQHWNSYFFYELEFMFLVWENEHLSPNPKTPDFELASNFSRMKLVRVGEKPEYLEPFTVYEYPFSSRQFYAFKTWDGRKCYDQLFDELDESQLDDPSYWSRTLGQTPPFMHLEDRQTALLVDLSNYLKRQAKAFIPAETASFTENIQGLKVHFYRINFLLLRAKYLQEELHYAIEQIKLERANLFRMNVLLADFTHHHQNMIQILAEIQSIIHALDNKKSVWPREFQESLNIEFTELKQKIGKRELVYTEFQASMLQVLNQAHDFSFVIAYTPEMSGTVLSHALWSLGLCLSGGLGLGLLAGTSGMALGLGFSLYLIFSSAALIGLALGAKAFYLAVVHADQELLNQQYELLPSWNSPIPK